jgi:hypothetical protein
MRQPSGYDGRRYHCHASVFDYEIEGQASDGAVAFQGVETGKRPAVLVRHGREGRSDARVSSSEPGPGWVTLDSPVTCSATEGYTNAGSRCGLVVLVQQSAEEIPTTYLSRHRGPDWLQLGPWLGRARASPRCGRW